MFYKNFIFSALVLLVIFSSPGYLRAEPVVVNYEYTKIIAGSGITAQSIVTDLSDNLYILGRFSGTVDLNPTEGEDNHTSNGSDDIFLTKINADGSYGYTKTIGGPSEDNPYQITSDSLGALYFVGGFAGSDLNFGVFSEVEGNDEHSNVGEVDLFLTKINSDGSYGYTKTIGSVGAYVTPKSVSVDSSGNVYVGGFFEGGVDFNPSGGIDTHAMVGDNDSFFTKINADGSYGYTKTFGSVGDRIYAHSVANDSLGNIYLSGYFNGTDVDFDPSVATDEYTSTDQDGFLTKINADGSYVYTKVITGDFGDEINFVKVDSLDNIYLAGSSQSLNLDVDPTVGESIHEADSNSVFLIKLNSDSEFEYAKVFDGANDDYFTSMALDSNDNVYLAGGFSEDGIDLDPSVGLDNHSNNGSADIYLIRINADGSYGYAQTMGGTAFDYGLSVTVDSEYNVYLGSQFYSPSVDFNPTLAGVDTHLSAETGYMALTKFSQPQPTPEPEVEEVRTSSGSRPRSSRPANSVVTQIPFESNSQSKFVYNLKIGTNNADKDKIKELQKYLETHGLIANISLESNETTTLPSLNFKFLVDFKLDANIPDVKELQKYLNVNGFPVSLSGPGSLNNETTFFGLKTKAALMLFQKSKGLTPDGIMGPITRGVLNAE